jgi:putative transposase
METQIKTINVDNEYQHYSHSVGTLMLHLQWVTKYRYKMFGKEEQKNLVTACIRRAASLHEIKIIEIEVMPEHVHVAVQVALTLSPAKVLQILKGISAKLFFGHNKKARLRYPKGHLWSKGKFAASLGFIQVDAARDYIKSQVEHHQGNCGL